MNLVKSRSEISPVRETSVSGNRKQRHLHLRNINSPRSIRRDPVTRGNLSKQLKQHKPKLALETPDKPKNSEIFRMFEKFKQKRDQKMLDGNNVIDNHEKDDDYVRYDKSTINAKTVKKILSN